MSGQRLLWDLRQLTGRAAVFGIGIVVLRGMNFLLLPFYTRVLSTDDYGVIAITTTIASLLTTLLPLKIDGALAKFHFQETSEETRAAALGTVWASMAAVAFVLALLLDRTGSALFARLCDDVPFDPYIRLVIWGAFFQTFNQFLLNLLQTRERAGWHVLLTLTNSLLTTGVIIYFVVWQGQGALGFVLGTTAAAGLCALMSAVLTLRLIKVCINRSLVVPMFAFCLPLVPHCAAGWFLELSDRVLLKRFVSFADIGIYSVGYQIGTLLGVIAACANSVWVPYLFRQIQERGDAAKTDLARLATYFVLGMTWLALGLILSCKLIVWLLAAPAYHSAVAVVPWVVLGHLCGALYLIPANLLFVQGRSGSIAYVTVTAAAINIGLNLWLIPQFGYLAAAWSTLAGYAVILLGTSLAAQRVFPLPYEFGRLRVVAMAAISVVVASSVLPPLPLMYHTVVAVGLWLAFPCLLIALGFLTLAETDLLVRRFPRFRMLFSTVVLDRNVSR